MMAPKSQSKSWWSCAPVEDRLKQIDGGIDLGMTARQIALASGCGMASIHQLARDNDRRFVDPHGGNAAAVRSSRRRGKLRRDKSAFLRGDRVDFTGNAALDRDDFALDEVPA